MRLVLIIFNIYLFVLNLTFQNINNYYPIVKTLGEADGAMLISKVRFIK